MPTPILFVDKKGEEMKKEVQKEQN
jgi:hypothetical protein